METITIPSKCHLSEVKWIPEPGSRLHRKREVNARHASNLVKRMTWKPGQVKALNAWRKEMGYSAGNTGYRIMSHHSGYNR